MRIGFGIFAVLALLLVPAAPAPAAFPGTNGDVAITNDQECDLESSSIWTFDPDNGELTGIYGNPATDASRMTPAWSSDGEQFAFEFSSAVSRSDGRRPQSQPIAPGREPGLSPDGTRSRS